MNFLLGASQGTSQDLNFCVVGSIAFVHFLSFMDNVKCASKVYEKSLSSYPLPAHIINILNLGKK